MFPEVLPENGKDLLNLLNKENLLENFYLEDKMPEMLKQVKWENVKKYFKNEEKKLFKKYY